MLRASADAATVTPAARAGGRVRVPGDKSISHRYAMLAALADGESIVTGYSPGADCAATLACLRALGVSIRVMEAGTIVVAGRGVRGLAAPRAPLDAANSGTTLRLLSGILAAHSFTTTIGGDASLARRPMRRIIEPLTRMGARIDAVDGRPPLVIHGTSLRAISHAPEVPSAQVKGGVLLAGLQADGTTRVVEPAPTRDHTERALRAFGARVECRGLEVAVAGGQRLSGRRLEIPGDISGAIFWAALAAGTPGAEIEIPFVGLNPTRTAVLPVLRRAGATVDARVERDTHEEPAGTLRVEFKEPRSFNLEPHEVPGVIDEIPALAALAVMLPAGESFSVRGAAELRVKESDRITSLVNGLRALGVDADERPDGFIVRGSRPTGGAVAADGDHRLVMAFTVVGLGANGPTTITGADVVSVSYPAFCADLSRLAQ